MLIYLSNFSISFNRSSSETPLVDHWSVLNNFFATFNSWLFTVLRYISLSNWSDYARRFLGWSDSLVIWRCCWRALGEHSVGGKHSKHRQCCFQFLKAVPIFSFQVWTFVQCWNLTLCQSFSSRLSTHFCNFVISLYLCINSMLSKFKDVSVFSIVMYSLNPVIIV